MTPKRRTGKGKVKAPLQSKVEIQEAVPLSGHSPKPKLLTKQDYEELVEEYGEKAGAVIFRERCISASLQYARQVSEKASVDIMEAKNETIAVLKSNPPSRSRFELSGILGILLVLFLLCCMFVLPIWIPDMKSDVTGMLILKMFICGLVAWVMPGHFQLEGRLAKLNDAKYKASGAIAFALIPLLLHLVTN